jgi:hypothetical protein
MALHQPINLHEEAEVHRQLNELYTEVFEYVCLSRKVDVRVRGISFPGHQAVQELLEAHLTAVVAYTLQEFVQQPAHRSPLHSLRNSNNISLNTVTRVKVM